MPCASCLAAVTSRPQTISPPSSLTRRRSSASTSACEITRPGLVTSEVRRPTLTLAACLPLMCTTMPLDLQRAFGQAVQRTEALDHLDPSRLESERPGGLRRSERLVDDAYRDAVGKQCTRERQSSGPGARDQHVGIGLHRRDRVCRRRAAVHPGESGLFA